MRVEFVFGGEGAIALSTSKTAPTQTIITVFFLVLITSGLLSALFLVFLLLLAYFDLDTWQFFLAIFSLCFFEVS